MSNESLPNSPYKGLMSFTEQDARFFFGRERERKIISANLRTRRLTLLYGPSGVGKSSLINAGVVSHIRHRAQRKLPNITSPIVASLGKSPNQGWRMHMPSSLAELKGHRNSVVIIVFNTWVGDPLKSLQDAILDGVKKQSIDALQSVPEERLRTLGLTEFIEEVMMTTGVSELLIILDQFEEYFVYHPVDEGSGKFDDEFSRAVVNLGMRVNFLISIREDWLARLDRFKGHIPSLFENTIRIDDLEREAAREAISKPIEKYNEIIRENEGGPDGRRPKIELENKFIFMALDQLQQLDEPDEAGLENPVPQNERNSAERRIQTSRLQLVLQHLWDKVKNDLQPVLGAELLSHPDTVKRIFQLHLEESLEHLTISEKMDAASLFCYLITPSGTKFASTAKELAVRCSRQTDEIRELLTKLCNRNVRVLTVVGPSPGHFGDEPHYELASDVLAAPILAWVKDVRAQQQWATAARKWFWRGVILFLLLSVSVTVGALLQAREKRRKVEAAQREAEAQKDRAQGLLAVIREQDERIPYSKAVLRGHTNAVISAFFTSDGHVLTASTDGSVILWDIESKKIVREFSKGNTPLTSASSSRYDNMAVTGSFDGSIVLWNTNTGRTMQLHEPVGGHITDVRFSPDGEFVVAANVAGSVMMWKVATGELIRLIPGNNFTIRQLSFSLHGTFLAAASDDYSVRIWRIADWSEQVLTGHSDVINGIDFSPDERLIATASRDTTVRVWNLSNGSAREFKEHTASVNSVSFNQSGNQILTASDDKTARIWNLETMKVVELLGHTDKVLSAAFDDKGEQVVTGSKDNSVRIWSAITGWNVAELRGHLNQVTYVAFAPDGRFVLSASDDATARVWDAPRTGPFHMKQPTIDAKPNHYIGICPVTIRFIVTLTADSGSGIAIYRLRGSDGRIWPVRTQTFNAPSSSYVNWYWRITDDYSGSETIEVIEPRGVKKKSATFTVKCTKTESISPEPSPSPSP